MCGIFTYYFEPGQKISMKRNKQIMEAFIKTKHRGPDNSIIKNMKTLDDRIVFGFHRLCIMDRSDAGNQPMNISQYPNLTLVCNGEIYNYKQLAEAYVLLHCKQSKVIRLPTIVGKGVIQKFQKVD